MGRARPPPTRVGLALRLGAAANATGAAACEVSFAPANRTLGAGAFDGWPARALPQPGGAASVELRIFLDRSIAEVYSAGAALTARCSIAPVEAARAAVGVAVFAEGAAAGSLAAWRLGATVPRRVGAVQLGSAFPIYVGCTAPVPRVGSRSSWSSARPKSRGFGGRSARALRSWASLTIARCSVAPSRTPWLTRLRSSIASGACLNVRRWCARAMPAAASTSALRSPIVSVARTPLSAMLARERPHAHADGADVLHADVVPRSKRFGVVALEREREPRLEHLARELRKLGLRERARAREVELEHRALDVGRRRPREREVQAGALEHDAERAEADAPAARAGRPRRRALRSTRASLAGQSSSAVTRAAS